MSIVRLVCVLALGAPLDAALVAAPKPAVKMSPKMDTALVLRGGASLGPITPHLAMKINCVMYVYFASLFSNFLTFLPNKPYAAPQSYASAHPMLDRRTHIKTLRTSVNRTAQLEAWRINKRVFRDGAWLGEKNATGNGKVVDGATAQGQRAHRAISGPH